MKNIVIFSLILQVTSLAQNYEKLPSTIPVCSRNHPKLSDCILNSVKILQPRLVNGDLGSGLQVPSLEPLHISEISYGENNGLKIHLLNLKIHGTSKFKIEKFRVNFKDLKMDIILHLPRLELTGQYRLKFKFFNQLIDNDGDYMATFENSQIRASMKAHRYLKNGVEYAKIDPLDIKFNRGKITNFRLKNLFSENPLMNEIVHSLITNSPDYMTKNIQPKVNAVFSKIATEIAGKILEGYPLEELFPY
ncbi:hypothetical protein PVAND_014696 [Polypedilum vanderplanki]|uniref:Uncharacterized protein n=1 Tax=Polypedilum vanderplanki TaxID=319348 RepID=A0A9J6B9X6_POLVA|nr:hypothetical protein PVAND_014696 [Polypedilum vanderplanki]